MLSCWTDTTTYRDRLRECSAKELEDIYYHINILKHPEQYRAVLTEFERRRLKPYVSEYPLPGFRWDMSRWIARVPVIKNSPALSLICANLATLIFSFGIAYLTLVPFWILIVEFRVINLVSSFVYMLSLSIPIFATWSATPPYGKRGTLKIALVIGIALAGGLFAKTGTYQAMAAPLMQAEHSDGASSMPGMGLGGF